MLQSGTSSWAESISVAKTISLYFEMMDISGLVTVAVAIIAGGSALLGAWLTTYATNRQARELWKLQQAEKWRETSSHRLEELYHKIDQWSLGIREIAETHLDVQAGRLSRDEARSRIMALPSDGNWDPSRVNQLLDVYAPDLKILVEDMRVRRRNIISYSREWIEEDADVDLAIEVELRAVDKALADIREHLSQEIREVQAVGQTKIGPTP